MITRKMLNVAKQRAQKFPVLTITGPRQSGKTTLAKACFPDYGYANLEDPETRELAESDYRRFFAMYNAPLIIDEIRRVPTLASASGSSRRQRSILQRRGWHRIFWGCAMPNRWRTIPFAATFSKISSYPKW